MKTSKRRYWVVIFVLFLITLINGCKDEDVGLVGVCPAVLSTNPAMLAVNVPLDQVITVTFNEPMNPLTIDLASFSLQSSNSTGRGAAGVSGTFTYDAPSNSFSFIPTSHLTSATVYRGTVESSVKDKNGIPLQVDYVWTFTTVPPTVITTDPLNLATGVALNKVISATFSEAVNPLTVTTSTFTVTAGAITVTGAVSYSGVTATLTPAGDLLPGTLYKATITTGTKTPLGGALASDYAWTFTTGASPTVTSTDPIHLTTGIALNKIVTASFSEVMDPLTLTTTTFTVKAGTTQIAGTVLSSGATSTFTPLISLSPGTIYTATITTGAKNLLGIPLANDYVWDFITGASPTVTLTDPLDLATGVALNKVISATFSEAMNPLLITSSTFILKDGATIVTGTLNYSGTTATLTPTVDLLPGTLYTATITTGAKNPLGTPLASDYVWTFTTGASPSVTLTDPLDLATGIALNKVISATFSEAMNPLLVTSSTFILKDGATIVTGTLNYSGTTATLTPTVDLLPGTLYTATITTGAKNPLGTPLASDYVWTFTTGTSPTVTLTDPLDLATGVALNKVISATFSEAMNPLTMTSSTFTLKAGATIVAGTLNYSGTTATLTPTIDLLPGTLYTATITTGAKNLLGTPLASDYVWTFTTGASPTVTLTDPLDLATGVALNKVISATFSEAMNPLTMTSSTFTLKAGATIVAGTLNYSGTTATLTPTIDLLPGTLYTATITTGAKNLLGTPLASDYVWTFTTGASPTVTLTDPLDLATGVALNKVISATFSEAMNPLTLTSSTFTLKDGATIVTGTLNYSGTTATLAPTIDLLPGTLYTATITTGAKNPLGTPLASDYVWTFTTGASPTVTLTDPLDLATGVALNKVISATFSEAMNPLTMTSSTFTLKAGATTIAGTLNYSGTTATLTPTIDLLPGTLYTATITTGVKNLLGTPLASDYVWTFTTGASPTVTLTDPLDLATGVALNKVISATFSEAMNPLTMTSSTFTLKAGATTIAGTLNYSGTTATLTPTIDLLPGTLYTATITTGVKNLLGTPLASDYVWTFTTGASPTVTLTDPLDLATGVALNKVISATFSEAMNSLHITSSTFILKVGATTVAGNVNYSGTTATLTPTIDLLPGTLYTATITAGAKNLLGTPLANDYVWTFTTGLSPTVLSTDPLNLTTNVPLNKIVGATFSIAMDPLTLTTSTFKLMNGLIPVLGVVNYAGTTATFIPTVALLSGTTYTATVSTGAKSLTGFPLAIDYVWSFVTVAAIPPTVISTDPIDLATNVALDKVISATFSTAMDPVTISTSTFTLMLGVTPVSGTVNYTGTTATLTPSSNLLSDNTYTATITIGAKDLAGTPLANDYAWTFSTVPHLGPLAPVLATVARFGIIAGVGVSNNAGPSQINNLDVGISPGARSSITGFFDVDGGPGLINNGAFYASDDVVPPGINAMLVQAQLDLVTAYDQAKNAITPASNVAPADLGGQTLAPGIWTSTATMLLQNGDLILDAQGDANAVWIFQVGSAFTSVGSGPFPSASGGNVKLAGGAQAKNVYWQVSSSATIGDYTSFKGNVLAFTSITMNAGAVAEGRMLARNAAVTMTSTNIINKP